MYAYFKKLDYFSTECIYSPNAYRGFARAYIKDVEKIRPSAIIDIIHSGESLSVKKDVRMPVQGVCERCGYISSNAVCKACVMLEGLNKGLPRLGIGKTHKERRKMQGMLQQETGAADSTPCTDQSVGSSCKCEIQTDQSGCSSQTCDSDHASGCLTYGKSQQCKDGRSPTNPTTTAGKEKLTFLANQSNYLP